jgi:hypothetical protein
MVDKKVDNKVENMFDRNTKLSSTTLDKVDSTMPTITDMADKKADNREVMQISPSSTFQNIPVQNVDESDYEEEEDYAEEIDEKLETKKFELSNKSDNVVSSTSRSTTTTTTQPPSVSSTTITTTTTTLSDDNDDEDEIIPKSEMPFFPTRMTKADTSTKTSTMFEAPTKMTETPTKMIETPTKMSETLTKTAETPTKMIESPTKMIETPTKMAETPTKTSTTLDEEDKQSSLKDLLRSGKYGSDPMKIRELLKNLEDPEKTISDQEEVDPKDIFKKYANMAKTKTTEVR